MKYEVHVTLEYNGIVEAKDESEAKKIAREDACFFGDIYGEWDYDIYEIKGEQE